jgi:hypothetical protein
MASGTDLLTVFLSLGFVALLAAEWRLRSRWVRVATLVLALGVYWFAAQCLYCALRTAMGTPPAARDTLWSPSGRRLPEYQTGAKTMYREALANVRRGQVARDVALGTIVWLALAPALRRNAGPAFVRDATADDAALGVGDADTPRTQPPAV